MVTFVPRYMWMLSYQNDITQLTTPNSALQLVIDDGGTGFGLDDGSNSESVESNLRDRPSCLFAGV